MGGLSPAQRLVIARLRRGWSITWDDATARHNNRVRRLRATTLSTLRARGQIRVIGRDVRLVPGVNMYRTYYVAHDEPSAFERHERLVDALNSWLLNIDALGRRQGRALMIDEETRQELGWLVDQHGARVCGPLSAGLEDCVPHEIVARLRQMHILDDE